MQDQLTINMQNEAIKIASERLGKPLPDELAARIRQVKWSYMGLEMIIDTVSTIPLEDLEDYISRLE